MTDDPLGRDDASLDASDFLDWLDEMADAEGKSREELIQRLVSSYWTLDEMLNLMEQADPDADLPAAGTSDRADGPQWKRLDEVEQDLAGRIDELDARLEDLRSELESEPADDDAEGLAAIAERVEALETSLSSRQDAIEERIETEFGHLRTILEHLLSTTDDLEDRTARLESGTDEAVRAFLDSAERLADLKRTAAQLGVRTATCGYCDTKLEIALLPTPECPQCDRPFADIEPKQGWFGSATLVVADGGPTGRPTSPPPAVDDEPDDGASPARSSDSGGFDWIGDD